MISAETSVASLATPIPEMSTQRSSGRGFPSRGASAAAGRGGRGRGRGSAPGMQTEARTQARVYVVTQQDADAAPYVVTSCDAPKPGGPLTTRQPAEYKWGSGYPTPL